MSTIWKYKLKLVDDQKISMPVGARILTAQMQGNELVIWAHVNPKLPPENRRFAVVGTGQPAPDIGFCRYIATCQAQGSIGLLVLHVFELP